jgi:hypothetical protein
VRDAADRARELVALIDQVLRAHLAADVPTLIFPEEAKPVGPYATFGECVGAQRRRGHTEDEARRICGAIEAQGSGKRATRADMRYLRAVLRATARAQRVFEGELRGGFARLGDAVARAWRDLKQGEELRVELTLRAADLDGFAERELRRPYERLYTAVGEVVYGASSQRLGVDVGWNLEDRLARQVVAQGGRRLGLVDLAGDTRSALFSAIHDARAAGEGPLDFARRIREYVPAGRFTALEAESPGRGVAYRAELIARTETTFARNVSGLAAAQEAGFERFYVFDARLGPTDAECEEIDGAVVDADEAARLLEDEHPNGTRSISPLPRA